MTHISRLCRTTLAWALLAACVLPGAAHAAEAAYPSRPVRLMLGFAPGGGLDATARIVSRKLTELMGQSWVVENRAGAGGNLVTEFMANATPDGYTVMMAVDSQMTVNPSLYKLAFNIERIQPVTMVATVDQILLVHPSVQAKTLDEFIALAKRRPGDLNYASSAVGGSTHLAGELLKKRAGIDLVHVPYKGGGPAAAGILAGEVQAMVGSVASTIGYVKSGRLRAIASTGAVRSKVLPDLATIAETGYPGFVAEAWYAFFAPPGTPRAIVDRIHADTVKALQDPEVQKALSAQGLNPVTSTPAELAARIRTETDVWAGVIRDAKIRLE